MKIGPGIHILSLMLLLLGVFPSSAQDFNLQTLEKAHSLFRAATNQTMFAKAAKQYELLVNEEKIRNGYLYYNVGNAWFMAGDIGRAILNYRRAEKYLPHNDDLKNNLEFARQQRIDVIPEKKHSSLVDTLFGWHYKTSTTTRWWLFAFCYLLTWGGWIWARRSHRNEIRIAATAATLLAAVLAVSLLSEVIISSHIQDGVILSNEVIARKGDGEIYAPAFQEPLHAGTEFQLLEKREGWWHIRLADSQSCWIPANSAETVD